jgi:beta-lactamase superfamily II metal-dependent hydrolase
MTTRASSKKTARKASKKATQKAPARKSGQSHGAAGLKVRMYRVGFGDFFLITVPTRHGDRYIVIDCGVFKGTTGKGDIGSIADAVEDLFKLTKGQLALVIMTHRHADHIAGFSRAERFKDFKASMVWMPYWEQFNDSKGSAHSLQADVNEMAMQLAMQFRGRSDPAAESALDMLSNATGVDFSAAAKGKGGGGGSNAKALDLLKNHLGSDGKNVKYYAAGDTATLPDELEGLTARILGPPPKDAQVFMKLTDLKQGVGQYLDAVGDAENGPAAMKPFDARWLAKSKSDYPVKDSAGYRIEYDQVSVSVNQAQPDMLAAAAKKIDTFLNNQSLVVLFTFGDKKLLFVGDAQAGNWENWLYKTDAPEKDPTKLGELKKDSLELLRTIDFYKVGHHGSTNATPIQVVQALSDNHSANGFVAMCSTQIDTYGNPDKDSEVPRIPLLTALGKGCALVRSDSFAVTVGGKSIPAGRSGPLPKPKVGKFEKKGLYVEYSF